MTSEAFTELLPGKRDTAVVFASPHSGRNYAQVFLGQSVLDERAIRSSEDAYVDKLYADAPDAGAPMLVATAPRAFIDLNRAADEFDPALIAGAAVQSHNPRISSGLGVIPRVVSGGRAIYRGKITLEEAHRRVGRWWRPYHDRLQRLLDESQFSFGQAILVDCHSMPHEALANMYRKGGSPAEIVLGDRYGATASSHVVERIEAAFAAQGFTVARNAPFAGAYIAQHYGRPSRNQHAVQVEIDRALYMDESTLELLPDFDETRARIARAVHEISEIGRSQDRMAAE